MIAGDLVQDVRRLLQSGADDHGRWLRENLRLALANRREDPVAVSALTGLAPGTVRGFLNGRPSSINNVLLMAEAVGYTVAELDRPPAEFQRYVETRHGSSEVGSLAASLLAFDESPTAMAVMLLDGTIVKVNHRLRELLGYGEGELIGAPTSTFSTRTEADLADQQGEMAETGVIRRRASQLRRKDGALVDVVSSAVVIRDTGGQPRYVIARAARTEGLRPGG